MESREPPLSADAYYSNPSGLRFGLRTVVIQESGCAGDTAALINRPWALFVDGNLSGSSVEAVLSSATTPSEVFVVAGEPDVIFAREASRRLPSEDMQFIALGGGSTIDLAKSVRAIRWAGMDVGLGYGAARTLTDRLAAPRDSLLAVPTTASSGAEVSRYYVLYDEARRKGVGRAWQLAPDVALLDPTLLASLTASQLVVGLVDAYAHALEASSMRFEATPLIRSLGRSAVSEVMTLVSDSRAAFIDQAWIARAQAVACMGGALVSNSRTGVLHVLGEALASRGTLSHPLSLLAFLPGLSAVYPSTSPVGGWTSSEVWDHWQVWKKSLEHHTHGLGSALVSLLSSEGSWLIGEVLQDAVLVQKEHPGRLTEKVLQMVLEESMVYWSST